MTFVLTDALSSGQQIEICPLPYLRLSLGFSSICGRAVFSAVFA